MPQRIEYIKTCLICLLLLIFLIVFSVWGYNKFFKLIYPVKYELIVNKAAAKYSVEPELIYAVIRSESGFCNDAVSKAGARGLMQITGDTFQWLQMYTHDEKMDNNYLDNPEINVLYGTLFISMLKSKYFSEEIALCAYNAGMNTAEKWLRDENFTSNGEELNFIPYKETRDYVKRVKDGKRIYKNLYFKK